MASHSLIDFVIRGFDPSVVSDPLLQILEEIEEASIRIYQFPECDSDEDEDFVEMNKDLKVY